ncbi:MAG: glucosamine-6-phosphate deaminase [Oscillospiraceae bacterium]
MEIKIFDNAEQIGEAAGKIFVNAINLNPQIVLGLATGASPIPTYKYIYGECKKGNVSLKNVKTYNLDEYVGLPRADKNSYYSFMHNELFNMTDIKEENVHFLDGNAADIEKECKSYDDAIIAAGKIDIQLLGIGQNGHIGFNEPNDYFTKGAFKIKLTDSTIAANSQYFDENPMPHYALTMGVGSIMNAKKIVLIATGKSKAEAIAAMINGFVDSKCPASILQFHHDVVVLLDTDAASLLK